MTLPCLLNRRHSAKIAQRMGRQSFGATNRPESARHGLPARQPDPKMTATGRRTPGAITTARGQPWVCRDWVCGFGSTGFPVATAICHCGCCALRPPTQPRRADHGHDRHRHAGHHHQHRDHRRRHSPAQAARKAPAEGRQVRQHQVRVRVEQLHVRPARHQRHDGEQAAVRRDGRLSADRQRLHLPEQSGKQEPADRGCRLQHPRLRQRPRRPQGLATTSNCPTSRASSSAFRSARPRTAWC